MDSTPALPSTRQRRGVDQLSRTMVPRLVKT